MACHYPPTPYPRNREHDLQMVDAIYFLAPVSSRWILPNLRSGVLRRSFSTSSPPFVTSGNNVFPLKPRLSFFLCVYIPPPSILFAQQHTLLVVCMVSVELPTFGHKATFPLPYFCAVPVGSLQIVSLAHSIFPDQVRNRLRPHLFHGS